MLTSWLVGFVGWFTDSLSKFKVSFSLAAAFKCAVRSFGRLTRTWPEDAEPHVGLGVSLARVGELELAAKALLRALELAPGDREAVRELARVYDAMGRAAEAEELREAGGMEEPK